MTTLTTHSPQTGSNISEHHGKHRLMHGIHLEMDDRDIAALVFDHPNRSVNVFDEAMLDELDVALDVVESLKPKGVIFLSAKASTFIAGADLGAFVNADEEDLDRLIKKGQELFERIAKLPGITVAAIHGACLGGGLELSLACDYRVSTIDNATRLGLPETLLGIIPAWGGSTRLPRLVGLPTSLRAILTGKSFRSKQALKMGLVDEVVPPTSLRAAAVRLVGGAAPKRKARWATNHPLSAGIIRIVTKRRTLRSSRGHYPALIEAIEVVTRGGYGSVEASLERERRSIMRLASTDVTANLMRLFHLQENAKKFRFDDSTDPQLLKAIHKTAVIGAGVMGAGLAQWLSKCGFPVLLKDIDRTRVASGMRMIHRLFREAKRYGILTQHEASRCLDVITPVTQDVPLHLIDLVIEAAVESLEVKKRIFAGLSEKASPETILATNTSALSVTALAEAPGVTHPERVIGIHFFNPVSRMKLVEVVVTPYTSPKVVERVLGFVRAIGKIPIVVKDSPGFLVNRILMPYLIGAGNLVDQGHDPEVVDEAMLDFGMPMGPLRLLDEIGLDVAEHVVTTMIEAFGERFESPRLLKEMVDEGNLGKKTGSGFYRYVGGKTETISRFRKQKDSLTCQEISRHLAGLMTDESVRCLEEGLVEKADQIDLAMILGTGFAPFRGGPMRWARGLGNPHE